MQSHIVYPPVNISARSGRSLFCIKGTDPSSKTIIPIKMPGRKGIRSRYRRGKVNIHDGRWRRGRKAAVASARRGSASVVVIESGGGELKFFDTSYSASIPSPTGATGGEADPGTKLTLCCPTQGDGDSSRDGRKYTMKSVQINGVVRFVAQTDQTAADVAAVVHIALVLDTQSNGAQLNSEDVYTNPSADAIAAATPLRNLTRVSRYKILKVWNMDMPQPEMVWDGTNVEQSGVMKRFSGYLKLDIPVECIANGGTIADAQDNSLHMIAFCSSTTTAPALTYNARVRFVG